MAAIEMRVEKDNRLLVGKNHYYNNKCRCVDCLSIWMGISCGDIIVKNFDGTRKMRLPQSKAYGLI